METNFVSPGKVQDEERRKEGGRERGRGGGDEGAGYRSTGTPCYTPEITLRYTEDKSIGK